MIELAGVLVTSAVSWGVGKILDVTLECFRCSQKSPARIGNVQKNTLGCRNCWREYVQFTNACDFTVGPNGRVAHAAGIFRGGWSVNRDPSNNETFTGWTFFYAALRARHLANRQIVVIGELKDYNNDQIYSRWDSIYTPNSDDTRWYENTRIPLKWDTVPNEHRDGRIFAVDLIIQSRFRDELCRERFLAKLWK